MLKYSRKKREIEMIEGIMAGWKHTTYHSTTFLRLSFVWKYILPLLMEKKCMLWKVNLVGSLRKPKRRATPIFSFLRGFLHGESLF